MKLTKMIEKLGGDRAAIAEKAGISVYQLNNAVAKDSEVLELKDGRFILVRKNSTIFDKP